MCCLIALTIFTCTNSSSCPTEAKPNIAMQEHLPEVGPVGKEQADYSYIKTIAILIFIQGVPRRMRLGFCLISRQPMIGF